MTGKLHRVSLDSDHYVTSHCLLLGLGQRPCSKRSFVKKTPLSLNALDDLEREGTSSAVEEKKMLVIEWMLLVMEEKMLVVEEKMLEEEGVMLEEEGRKSFRGLSNLAG